MIAIPLRSLIIGVALVATAAAAAVLKPTSRMADEDPLPKLETVIPESFGAWRLDRSVAPLLPSLDVQAKLDAIYNQVLARSYVDDRGRRVMLSIAYGGDQSDALRVHRPEVCYGTQGFKVSGLSKGSLEVALRRIPVMRMVARQGPRIEPVTYWITVGEKLVLSNTEHKLAQMRYGFSGRVPDGMIFRVSTIDEDFDTAYQTQSEFAQALLPSLPDRYRSRFLGGSSS